MPRCAPLFSLLRIGGVGETYCQGDETLLIQEERDHHESFALAGAGWNQSLCGQAKAA